MTATVARPCASVAPDAHVPGGIVGAGAGVVVVVGARVVVVGVGVVVGARVVVVGLGVVVGAGVVVGGSTQASSPATSLKP